MNEELTPAHQLAASRLFLTQGDVDDLIALAKLIPEGDGVVDLGAGSGTTALAVLQTRPEIPMITCDISAENLGWARANLDANNISMKNWTPVELDAMMLAGVMSGKLARRVGLLMHDASHEEPDVKMDLEAWLTVLQPGAYVWVHDYLPMEGAAETYPGVKVVCDELVEDGRLWRVPGGRGIGFIGVVPGEGLEVVDLSLRGREND